MALQVAGDDFDQWRSRLADHDVEVLSEIAWDGGARSLYFRDPDGHLLELATTGIWREETVPSLFLRRRLGVAWKGTRR